MFLRLMQALNIQRAYLAPSNPIIQIVIKHNIPIVSLSHILKCFRICKYSTILHLSPYLSSGCLHVDTVLHTTKKIKHKIIFAVLF